MRVAIVVVFLLSVASPLTVPVIDPSTGAPISLMCVGIVALAAIRARSHEPGDRSAP
jgi:hypothetical protein